MLGFLLSPVLQIEDIDGKPLVGGKVFVYEANTSNLATVYKDYNGTFNTNPVILDTAGHNTIIAEDDKLYDITVKDANDNLLFSVEDVAVGGEGGSAIVTDITVQAGNNGIAVGQSVVSGVKTFKVSADYNFLASKSDLANKQDKLSAGPNIDITSNVVSGKDWQSEIDAAVDAVATGFIPYSATNIPAGSSVSVFGDNMLLVGKNITGIAYGNLAVGENIYKTAPNGLMAGSGINGSQNDILVGNGVSAGNNALVLGDSISSLGYSIIIGGPSITGLYGESTIVAGNNNLTGMGSHNVVLGHANTATSGNDNVIIGRGNSTTGSENIVIGIDNSSNTNVSSDFRENTILGYKNVISGSNSTYNSIFDNTIIGAQNTAYDNGNGFYNLTILGYGNLFSGNNGYGTTILGQYNEVKGNATQCTFGGYSNKINGSISNSIIHGYYNEYKISGDYEALALGVFGYRNIITANDHADGSFIAGFENNIVLHNTDALICLGNINNIDTNDRCYVLGDSNTISGGQMYAIGSYNNTTGNTIQSYVFGESNAINNTTSAMAIGFTNTVSSNNTIRIGFGGSSNNCFIEITPDHIYAVKNNTTVTII